MTTRRSFLKSAAAMVALSLGGPVAAQTAEPTRVVATFSILGDMVEQVVGEHASVTTIVGPDADAHVYQPSIADARAVADADLIFVNGLGFETWSSTLIEESGTEAVVFVATEGITPLEVEGVIDPHAWNALTNGVIYVENIAHALSKLMPAQADTWSGSQSQAALVDRPPAEPR